MKKNLRKILCAVLAVMLTLSFMFVTVYADESGEAETQQTTDAGTTAAGTDKTTTAPSTTANGSQSATKETHYGIVTLIIVAVILVIILIVFLRDREKGMKTIRSFKSEFKKIVWADRHETLKNTVLVVIAIVLFAAVFGLVDFALSQLILLLGRVL